ncbi:MAG TPA: MarR family transcriptional regulator [Bacteroidia bacterium]
MKTIEQEIQQGSFINEQVKANINLLYTSNWLYNRLSSYLKPYDLTHEQFNVLRIIRGSHPNSMCQKDILSRMIAPSSNMTLLIKKLKAKQLVNVDQAEHDRREYIISITEEGLKRLSMIDAHFETEMKKGNINNLSDEEAKTLNLLLDKIRA